MEFSKWWINEFKTIKFPSQGTIFDYYIDPDTKKFLPWTDKVPSFELDPDVPLQVTVPKAGPLTGKLEAGICAAPPTRLYRTSKRPIFNSRTFSVEHGLHANRRQKCLRVTAPSPPSPPSASLRLPQASLVHTTETIRLRYFMDLLMEKSWPVMLVGNAGTGKSVMMGDKLESLNTDYYLVQAVPFNFYTTSAMLQGKAGLVTPCLPG